MAEKREIILDFQVEQGDAFSDLERLKSSMVSLKQQQQELQKAYKAGNITLEEYSKEIVRVEALSKKQSATYNEVQRSVTGLKNPIKELTKSNQDLASSLKSTGDKLQGYGVNVGGLSTKLAQFASPAGAAVGLIGLLGSAYANSTVGAKDLEFAQNQLASATHLVSNAFAEMFSSAEDGEGIVSQFINGLLNKLNPAIGTLSNILAKSQERMQDLVRDELDVRAKMKERLDENNDLTVKLKESQISVNERLAIGNKIAENLKLNEAEILEVKQKQLDEIRLQRGVDKDNENLKTTEKKLVLEIAAEKSGIGRQLKTILTLESNITDEARKQAELNAKVFDRLKYVAPQEKVPSNEISEEDQLYIDSFGKTQEALTDITIDGEKSRADFEQAKREQTVQEDKEAKEKMAEQDRILYNVRASNIHATVTLNEYSNQQMLQATGDFLGQASRLFKKGTQAQKTLATASALIKTYQSAAEAYEAGVSIGGPYALAIGAAFAAVAVATGLANVAQIQGIEFAGGGYTGDGGKYEPAGTVHKGEVVWNQQDVAMAGGPQRANAMRPTYADGGIAGQAMANQISQQVGMAKQQAIQVFLGMKEFNEFNNKIDYKESLVTA